MKIGVAGCGFVGNAVVDGITKLDPGHEFVKYDPYLFKDTKIDALKDCDMAFICVPTPMNGDGKMDDVCLRSVFGELSSIKYKGLCVIKSTTIPSVVRRLIVDFKDLRIVTNPEFLTERTALNDFINSKWVIIGGNIGDGRGIADENSKELYNFFIRLWPNAKFSLIAADEAMMVKYMCNTWFAVKVSLINEFHDLVERTGMDWDNVIKAFATDERVGPTHLQCPGPDGDRGWGGKCFPKDLNALLYVMRQLGIQRDVLEGAWSDNEHFRKNKDWLKIKWATT